MRVYEVTDCSHRRLQETLTKYAKDGWTLHTAQFDGAAWTLIFQR